MKTFLSILFICVCFLSKAQERHLVLTPTQRDFFISKKSKTITDSLDLFKVDYVPVLLKNGNYFLPEAVLFDKRFDPIRNTLNKTGDLTKINIRVVLPNELITTTP